MLHNWLKKRRFVSWGCFIRAVARSTGRDGFFFFFYGLSPAVRDVTGCSFSFTGCRPQYGRLNCTPKVLCLTFGVQFRYGVFFFFYGLSPALRDATGALRVVVF